MRSAHVIFEGIDRCGKSSMVEKMQAETGWDTYKMRVPTTLQESGEFYDLHLNQIRQSDRPSIWDRGLLSELVYGYLYRPQECPAWYRRQLIERTKLPSELPIVVVYIYPLYDSLLLPDDRRFASRDEELHQYDHAYMAVHWLKVSMSKHTIRNGGAAWKNRGESWEELRLKLEDVIGP